LNHLDRSAAHRGGTVEHTQRRFLLRLLGKIPDNFVQNITTHDLAPVAEGPPGDNLRPLRAFGSGDKALLAMPAPRSISSERRY